MNIVIPYVIQAIRRSDFKIVHEINEKDTVSFDEEVHQWGQVCGHTYEDMLKILSTGKELMAPGYIIRFKTS